MANVKISALSTIPGNAVSGNDLFLLTQTANAISRSLSVTNARIAISDSNDYITYSLLTSNLNSFAAYANNTFTTNAAIDAKISALVDSSPEALNTLRELANALGNDSSFSSTIINYVTNVSESVLSLQVGLSGANTAIANVRTDLDTYASYANSTFSGGGGGGSADTVQSNLTAYSFNISANINSVQSNAAAGLSGTNSALSSNVGIFTGAFTGSNVRISGTESNVIALQTGLSGSNASIVNLQTGLSGSNTSIVNLQTGLSGTNSTIASKDSISNVYATYLAAMSNDGATLLTARSNDYATLLSAYSNDFSTYLTLEGGISGANTSIVNLQTGLSGTNSSVATKDSIANVYATYLAAMANDGTTLSSALSNDYSTYLTFSSGLSGSNSAIVNLQSGLSGTNSALSSNVGIFTGAFTGSNAVIAATESNVLSLQGGISGSNVSILNLNSGLAGANANIASITNAPVTFQSDVTIRGNLSLVGNTTIVVSNTISFGDSLLALAANNTSDTIDIGVYGHFSNGSANSHSGIFRSSTSKDWMIFSNYSTELSGNSSIVLSDPSFSLANLRVRTANASQDFYAANSIISTRVYSDGVELRSNDYATYLTVSTGLEGSNTSIVNLQTGLVGTNSTIASKDSVSNVYATYLVARGGIEGANAAIATKDSVSNVYATYLTAMANDSATLAAALSNDYSTLLSSYSNDGATLSLAYSNDYATLSAAHSNDYATYLTLEGGIEGSNTAIVNLQTGLSGTNTTVSTKDSIANVYATYLVARGGIDGANTAIINLQTGLTGSNSTIATKDSVANVYSTWNYLNSNITSFSSYANTTFSTKSNAAELASAIGSGGGGNTSSVTSKTYNIIDSFYGPLTGNFRFTPINAFTITKAQMLNSAAVTSNLVISLLKNDTELQTFTMVTGNSIQNFSGLNYSVSNSDYLTINVVSGGGYNFSFTISN
jgi:hypothetical protein